jgi:hypothetical protein
MEVEMLITIKLRIMEYKEMIDTVKGYLSEIRINKGKLENIPNAQNIVDDIISILDVAVEE